MNHRPQRLKTILSVLAMIFALVFFIQITQAPAKDTQPNLAVGLVQTTALKCINGLWIFCKNSKSGLIARRLVVQIHSPQPKITKGLRITSKPFFLVHTQKIHERIRSDAQIAVLYVISGYSEGIPPVYHQ